MVAAPTSSGKTVVAEYALWRALREGTRAIYTAPIKALSNQKRRDLERMFPGQVGLLTGDRSEKPEAPIVVMTTEVLRNMLVEDPGVLDQVAYVVFDEVHYLADPDRGTVWEEAIITCPPHVRLVCLSATIANAEEIATWVGATHREIALVRHDERPVPLDQLYFTQGRLHRIRDERGVRTAMFLHERRLPTPHPSQVLTALAHQDLLPAIWFSFSRQGAQDAALDCVRSAPARTPKQQDAIEEAIDRALAGIPPEDRRLPQISLLLSLLRRGVAFHHAGLLPPLKELVEHLFSQGYLSVVCATDTLAVGINMPARTVVLGSLSRPLGGLLTPNDFSQLTGRAGRRGIDRRGAVVLLPARWYQFEAAYREVTGPLQPVLSAFRLRYSTVLTAMEGPDGRLDHLIRASLRQFQIKGAARRAAAEIERIRLHLATAAPGENQDGIKEYLAAQARLAESEREQQRAKKARAKNPHSRHAARRHGRGREQRETLAALLRHHPHHGAAMAIQRRDPERLALLRRLGELEVEVAQAERESDREAIRTGEAVRTVLTRLGYIDRHGLTHKARGMREIVAASGIVLSELYQNGAFRGLDPAELAELLSWFANDSQRRRANDFRLPPGLWRLRQRAEATYGRIVALEVRERIELAQGPSDWCWGVALAWCRGASIATITERIELGEGDIVSLLNKTVDLLDQFTGMLERYADRELLAIAGEARDRLVRGLVALVRAGDGSGAMGPSPVELLVVAPSPGLP